jgi:hypothetical protein
MGNFNRYTIPNKFIIKINIDELPNEFKLSLINTEFGEHIEIDNYIIGYFVKIEDDEVCFSTKDPFSFTMKNPCSEIPLPTPPIKNRKNMYMNIV